MKKILALLVSSVSLFALGCPKHVELKDITLDYIREEMKLVKECCTQTWENSKFECTVYHMAGNKFFCREITKDQTED